MLEHGLEQITQTSLPIKVPLKTWTAKTVDLPLNLSKNSTYSRKHQNTIATALQEIEAETILDKVRVEFEIR